MATRSDLFAAENTQRLPAKTWIAYGTASNATASATKNAAAGARHYITGISASFVDEAAAAKTVTLKYGTDAIAVWACKGARDLRFSPALEVAENSAATVELAAGGSDVVGHVVLTGFTL